MRLDLFPRTRLLLMVLVTGMVLGLPSARAREEEENDQPPLGVAAPGTVSEATPITAEASAVVNFGVLAEQAARSPAANRPVRTWMPREFEAPPEPYFPPAPESRPLEKPGIPLAPSPLPTTSFKGLDDIPMADSSYIVIPPDVGGAVGPTRVMCGFNNNYRIFDKATGAIVSTVGTATFWASVVDPSERLSLTDPRTTYDPYNDRWIAVMQTVTSGAGKILVGVSQTSDPAGSWYLYSFNSGSTIDFPNLGFNKNWISVAINGYRLGGTFQQGLNLIVDYPSARTGTGSGTLISHSRNTHFCSGPCATYSATSDTLYVVTHLSSSGATYELDTITGTPGSPTYTSGGSHTRTGGGWAQPNGNILPQSAPNSGSSACGSTPCPIETQDAYIRACPTYRDGYIYYAQTVGLPSSSYTHTAAQWTKIAAPSGDYVDGGRVEDPTATSTNGGKWYANTHIAVNAAGSFIVAYSQFSSTQHASAGYSIHVAGDAAGTTRDPQIYHAGEDYYHKTFSTANGRNRWGDFSTAQVDPSDDMTLWALQEYGGTRSGTDDGNTGANSSRWSSWWAGVGFGHTITASAGTGGSISPSGAVPVADGADQAFAITPDSCYTVADVLVDSVSVGADTAYTFTNVTTDHTISASFAPIGYTIVASTGPGGFISPTDTVAVACGADQGFTITPDSCFAVSAVVVDGDTVGADTAYTFTNVTSDHTISASFTPTSYTIVASAGPGGSIAPSDTVAVACGADQAFTITPDPGFGILDVVVDGGSVGPDTSYTFHGVTANHTIAAAFADTSCPSVTVLAPNGGEVLVTTTDAVLSWTASDNVGVTCVDLLLSRTGTGGTYETLASCIPDSGSYTWTVTGPATTDAVLEVVAHDAAGNQCEDVSDTTFTIQDVTAAPEIPVTVLALEAVDPNPTSGAARIRFSLPAETHVRIDVFDTQGRMVATLTDRNYSPGRYEVPWDGEGNAGRLASGIYFIRMETPGSKLVRRVTLIR
jgi:hypothetical protein